ncbi:MAG: energy transducer TonB, partial [Myxococcales bacterium]
MHRLRFIAAAALALCATRAAHAQDAPPTANEHTLTPPKLTTASQPEYPASKLESGESAEVGLVLTLDAAGVVTDVAVASSGGSDFDQSAIAAAQQLRFQPATRDGEAVPAKIPFRIRFEAPPALPVLRAEAVRRAEPEDSLDIDVEG